MHANMIIYKYSIRNNFSKNLSIVYSEAYL